MLDTVQIIFWSVTYVLIIVAGFCEYKDKKVAMPYFPGMLNFSWEICALLYSRGFWGHIIWCALDCVIVFLAIHSISNKKDKKKYLGMICVFVIVLILIFQLDKGMLISAFLIDLIMAVWFLRYCLDLSSKCKVSIAITKLIGDTAAGIFYAPNSIIVAVIAIIVFICNVIYLIKCMKEKEN